MLTNKKSVHKRDGSRVEFDSNRIYKSLFGAFQESEDSPCESNIAPVLEAILCHLDTHANLSVEYIQDVVEGALMEKGFHQIAKRYILYREEHRLVREYSNTDNLKEIYQYLEKIGKGLQLDILPCAKEVLKQFYLGISDTEIKEAHIVATRSFIEKDPAYSTLAARILLDYEKKRILKEKKYTQCFEEYIKRGVEKKLLCPNLLQFDLEYLSDGIREERDELFDYLGLQILIDRYLIRDEEQVIELPQYFWMRVAMGLCLHEENKEQRVLEFYDVMSQLDYLPGTPTLFQSGTLYPQLSSCYLTTVEDSLEDIFKLFSDDAKLSKWAGGLGNDWSNVRATGSLIHGTHGKSQGVIPFLKIANDVALAVNQGGKRRGALCAYLEPWHLDFEEFIELRKNTGDHRRRTHDMHTAAWIPDLFMERVLNDEQWTLFCPNDVSDLHDLYGKDFSKAYRGYEEKTQSGEIKNYKQVSAKFLWRKMLSMLFETGHPWITFKDPSNIRSPQKHVGTIHSSNLCTEILLNTSSKEVAVCNLGSINLSKHILNSSLDRRKISQTVRTAIRMLDNVIDINFYPIPEAKHSNFQHRPIGLGVMGFQDALYQLGIAYESEEAIKFADESMEIVSFEAIKSSSFLAKERGTYASYTGSMWSKGILPIDSMQTLAKERKTQLEQDQSSLLDWQEVRNSIKTYGMRNSNVLAIAPTATIANIAGVTSSIEPSYKHLYSRSNLSGEFTVVNKYLINELKKSRLWSKNLLEDLKYYDGSIQDISYVPTQIKNLYKTAFEIDPHYLIECASRRQKWIDMGQSLNLYLNEPNGKILNSLYMMAWKKGLKTTYYLRCLAATQIEKSTLDINSRQIQPRWMKSRSSSSELEVCRLDDLNCEACQ